MQEFEEARAEWHAPFRWMDATAPAEQETAQPTAANALAARARGLVRRLGGWLAERRRRRARPRIASWLAIDPRVLADIGVARADVQAAVYGGVPFEQLAAGRSGEASAGAVLVAPRPWRPKLRLVAADGLDAAA